MKVRSGPSAALRIGYNSVDAVRQRMAGVSPDLPNAALCPNGCNVRRADICLLEDGPELPSAKIGDSAMRFAESGQLNSVWGCLRLKERRAHWFCGHVDCAIARQLDN